MPKRSGRFYHKNEKDVMISLGLKPTKGSGSGWIEKEDGQNDYIIAQLKSTDAESIRVKLEDIEKLEYHATTSHKVPVFIIQFLKTNDIFLLARPMDIPIISQYIETGKTNQLVKVHVEIDNDDNKTKNQQIKKIKSGNRQKFWEEKERERAKWQRKK